MTQKHLQLLRNGSAFNNYAEAYNALIAKTNYADGTPILARYLDSNEHQKTLLGVVNNGVIDVINNVSDYVLRGYTEYTQTGATVISASDDVKTAIAKLDKKIANSSAAAATEVVEGTDAGNNMNIVKTAGANGQKIYTISLTDVASASALTAETAARKAVDGQNGQTYAPNANATWISGASDLNNADVLLSNAIDTVAAAKTYEIEEVTENVPETILHRYQLKDGNGAKSGDYIDIYKDSSIISIDYIDDPQDAHYQNLVYTYVDASGETQTTYVDMSELVLEAEFASGVTVTNHVAHGVVDPTSENYLTVGADGFKLSGVDAAIEAAINDLDATDTANENQYVSSVSETDGVITVSRTNLVNGKLSGYTKGSDATAVSTGDTLGEAIGKLENQIANSSAAAATEVVEGTDAGNNMSISASTGNNGQTIYQINLTDIASNSALTAEITARKAVDGQNGQTYAQNANTNYIANVNSLNAADVALDTAVGALSAKTVTNVAMTGGTAAITANTADGTKMITINTDGSQIDLTGYQKGSDTGAVLSNDSVNAAIGKLENQIAAAKAAATTKVVEGTDAGNNMVITPTTGSDHSVTYTIDLTDVASASALTKEISDRENGDSALAARLGNGVTSANTATAQLTALSGTSSDTSGMTSIGGAKAYAKDLFDSLSDGIDGLDAEKSTYSVSSKQFATYIKQENGLITEFSGRTVSASDVVNDATNALISGDSTVKDALNTLAANIASNTVTNSDGSIKVTTTGDTTDVNVNIKSGEHVLAKDGSAGLYTDIKLSGITPSSETIKEEYALIGTDGTQLGQTTVKIYKDSSLKSMELVSGGTAQAPKQYLRYTYVNDSGDTAQTDVDVSLLLAENEFQSGVTANANGIVHGVVDPTSEKDSNNDSFLTVGADGFKVDGIKNEIVAKINALDVTNDTAVAGQYVAAIEETDGLVAVKSRANVSDAPLNGYSKDSDATAISATDTVNEAISKLENQIDAAKDAATTKVVEGTDAGNNLSIASATSQDDGSITYTINLTDVASASALTAETAARKAVDGQNGDTYTANSGKKYISGATSLNDADVKLNDAIVAIAGSSLTGVTVNGVTGTVANNVATVDIDGADIKLSGYTGSETGAPATGDTVNAAIAKLYNKSVADQVKAGSATTVVTASTGTTVDVKLDTTSDINEYDATHAQAVDSTSKNVLEITQNGLYLNNNWDCGTY